MLIPGTRVKLGAAEDCDIILSDPTLPALLCELDIGESNVCAILPDGSAEQLVPFVIREFGLVSFAIGPADKPWEELRKPEPKVEKEPETAKETADDESAEPKDDDKNPEDAPSEAETAADAAPAGEQPSPEQEKQSGSKKLLVIVIAAIVLVVILAIAFFLWRRARCQQEEEARAAAAEVVTLENIAKTHGLQLKEKNGKPYLTGNFKLYSDRMAVRALALRTDSAAILDLTDDETLTMSASALLFTITEGGVSCTKAENRVVYLAGEEMSEELYEKLVKAFKDDLPAVEKLDISSFQTPEVVTEPAASPKPEQPQQAAETAEKKPDAPTAQPAVSKTQPAFKKTKQDTAKEVQPDYPIVGILTVPYPCVILNNGVRCVVGAQLGNAVIEKIESNCLTLREGERSFTWKP